MFNLQNWGSASQSSGDAGLALLPSVDLGNVEADSVIDYTMYVVLRGSSDSSLPTVLQSTSTGTPAPVIYAPDYGFNGELGTIVTMLKANLLQAGTRTQHLGTLSN